LARPPVRAFALKELSGWFKMLNAIIQGNATTYGSILAGGFQSAASL
jgi:hypothetical protein